MTTSPMARWIQQLRGAVVPRQGGEPTDGALLEEYLRCRDEASLAALIRRHAMLVWGVCRRVLRTEQDAEDAFQATFLVLVRKAESVKPRDRVASWLYGVAHQTALKARGSLGLRRRREREIVETPEPAAPNALLSPWTELLPLLDEELIRLPDRYRAVVVLCDLEGATRAEAARQLGVPEGTVAGWIARGRALLGKRLARRGVTLPGGLLAALLWQNEASAGAPPFLVSNTIQAASLIAAGGAAVPGMVSVQVAALTEGMLKSMAVSPLKFVLAAALVVGLVGGDGPALSLSRTAAAGVPLRTKPGAGPGGGAGSGARVWTKPSGGSEGRRPARTKPGLGPGFGEGAGLRARPVSAKGATPAALPKLS